MVTPPLSIRTMPTTGPASGEIGRGRKRDKQVISKGPTSDYLARRLARDPPAHAAGWLRSHDLGWAYPWGRGIAARGGNIRTSNFGNTYTPRVVRARGGHPFDPENPTKVGLSARVGAQPVSIMSANIANGSAARAGGLQSLKYY
jgi:hypothetical protein